MCETKRCPTPQGEEDGVSASRWQATEEVELELEAVQSAWCRCPRWPGAADGRSVDDLVPRGCVVRLRECGEGKPVSGTRPVSATEPVDERWCVGG